LFLDLSAAPKFDNPQQKKQFKKAVARVENTEITLEINRGKTFSASYGEEHMTRGTWSVHGKELLLEPTDRSGKPARAGSVQHYVISPNGNTLTLVPHGKLRDKLIFHR
jgi:hypothetical protein